MPLLLEKAAGPTGSEIIPANEANNPGSTASRGSGSRPCKTSSRHVTSTAPSRISLCGPADCGLSTRPGRANTGRPWSSTAWRAVIRAPSASQQQALRARIVLRAADGMTNTQIAGEVGVSLPTVGLWRRNFAALGLDGLCDAARSGRPREIDDDDVARVLAITLELPPDETTHWSVRRLAAATGISATTVHRIWREHKLKPHQVRSFKFSKDPQLAEKIIDVVGLYMDPPKGALVLCVDEKTQIQALDRTQPTLPIKPGKAARMTHDYKRNGTTSLYAALEIATGEITGACYPQHRHHAGRRARSG